MKIRILICGMLFSNLLYAQDGSGDSRFCVEIAPLSWLINLEGYSYQIGGEYKLSNNFSAYVAGAGYFPEGDGDRCTDLKGYNGRIEIKYYLNREVNGYYFSIEGMHKKEEFNWQDSIHFAIPYLTTYRVFKDVSCLTLKFGCQFLHKSRIVIDLYTGLGIRFKNIMTTLTSQQANALNSSDDNQYDSDEIPFFAWPGKSILPNIEAGFKIGYQIK